MIHRLRPIRTLVGPLLAGTGIWCALGQLSVAHPDLSSVRLAAPAPVWWWVCAVLFGLLIPAWRRRPLAASPALLASLPWWPVPLPPIALLWTGGLAWVPIGLALGAAFIRVRPAEGTGEDVVRPAFRSAAVAGVLTLIGTSLVAWSLAPNLPSGDEPHYLVITQSLLQDGDLRIQNNHDREDYKAYFGGHIDPAFIQRGSNGEVYSIHAPGTSLLVLPAFAMFGYRGAQVTILLLSAIAGALVWLIGWTATADRRAAWFCWAAIVGAVPFLVQSVTIYPDGPGLLVVAATILLLLHLERLPVVGTGWLIAVSVLLAIFPWLHTRFVVLAAGFGVLIAWRLSRDGANGWRRLAVFLAVPAASAAGWFAYFRMLYGTFNPSVPYGVDTGVRWAYAPGGVAGLIFDEQFGVLTYAPVLAAAAFAGLAARGGNATAGRVGRPAWPAALVALAYLVVAGTYFMWWAGVPATPARFAAAVLPVLAAPLAVVFVRSNPLWRAVWICLLGASLATSAAVLAFDHGMLAWNTRGVRSEWLDSLSGVVDLSRAWPSFFWQTVPGVVATEGHFAMHLAAALGVVALAAFVMRAVTRRVPTASVATAAAWWVALTMTVLVQTGWVVNDVAGIRTMTSQVALLNADAARRPIVRIAPWSIQRANRPSALMTIRVDRTDWFDNSGASWAAMPDVPAGTYEAALVEARPRAGVLSLRTDRRADPIAVLRLEPRSRQTFPIVLPDGAAALSFEPDEPLALAAQAIEIHPIDIPAASDAPVRRRVVSSATFGALEVSFFDDHVFVEADGFWVKGGQSSALSIAAAGRQSLTIHLANGAAANAVRADVDGRPQTIPLAGYESRTLVVPVGSSGVVELVLTSPAGFRPSQVGNSADARNLGVRVKVGE